MAASVKSPSPLMHAVLVAEPINPTIPVTSPDVSGMQGAFRREDVRAASTPEQATITGKATDIQFAVGNQNAMSRVVVDAETSDLIGPQHPTKLERFKLHANYAIADREI
jgi:hypothetical protein